MTSVHYSRSAYRAFVRLGVGKRRAVRAAVDGIIGSVGGGQRLGGDLGGNLFAQDLGDGTRLVISHEDDALKVLAIR